DVIFVVKVGQVTTPQAGKLPAELIKNVEPELSVTCIGKFADGVMVVPVVKFCNPPGLLHVVPPKHVNNNQVYPQAVHSVSFVIGVVPGGTVSCQVYGPNPPVTVKSPLVSIHTSIQGTT